MILPLQGDSIKSAIQRCPSALEHPASSEFVRTQSSLGRGSTGVEGAQDVDIEQVPSDGIVSTESAQPSGSTFLTHMQGINEAGAEVERTGKDKNHVSPRTPRTTLNVGTQTSMLGVAFAFFDADSALPRYDFERSYPPSVVYSVSFVRSKMDPGVLVN